MNNIPIPTNDNSAALLALAMNPAVASYPNLQVLVAPIQASYGQYLVVRGNPFFVQNLTISALTSKYLQQYYKSPPADLRFITELRNSLEHRICPMCGSMHRGTLDHYLPKNKYPVFSIFSLNLIPACKCNIKRKEILIGPNMGERILHPYFDACLSERLITAKFSDLGPVPRVSIQIIVSAQHSNYPVISFHFREIIEKTAIGGYLADRWSKLNRKPSLVVRAFDKNHTNPTQLQHVLEIEREKLDDLHGGKNNWDSVFISGLLDPVVIAWLAQKFSASGRIADSPLT